MQTLIDSGIAFVIALQSAGSGWIAPMRFFSELGTEEFFFLVLPLIYWSVNPALGFRVGLILVTSNLVNHAGKLIFASPRPYWVSSHVHAWWSETSFGAPSGHAQHGVVVWGMIAAFIRRRGVWAASVLLIFLIGFSRVFLGVHFPHDVVAGWLLGAAILWAFVRYWEPAAAWLSGRAFGQQTLIALIVSLIFIAVGWGVTALRNDYQLPIAWVNNALLAGSDAPAPLDPSGIFTSAGTFFGLSFGFAWIKLLGGYHVEGPIWKRAIRYVLGLIGVLILWMGLGEVFPRGGDALAYSLRFLRYALVGWWVTGGAPWLFYCFKLVEDER